MHLAKLNRIHNDIQLSDDHKAWIASNHSAVKYLSYFWMLNTPWSSEPCWKSATESIEILFPNQIDDLDLRDYVLDTIKDSFKNLQSMNSANRQTIGGLRPQLGYNDQEYDSRISWKKSPEKLMAISSLEFFLMKFTANESDLRNYWSVLVPVLFKILDDSDGLVKALGCRNLSIILDKLDKNQDGKQNYLTKSGLSVLFSKNIEVCLAYIPTLTKIEDSKTILADAYTTLIKLLTRCSTDDEQADMKLIQLVDGSIFKKMTLVLLLTGDDKSQLMILYCQVITEIVGILRLKTVILLQRLLLKVILPTFTDAFLLAGSTYSANLVDGILKLAILVMSLAKPRVEFHKYDILGGLTVFIERCRNEDFDICQFSVPLQKAIDVLVQSCENKQELEIDIQGIVATKPFMKTYLKPAC